MILKQINQKMNDKPKVIVSLTSFPAAISYAVQAIRSVLEGSLLPDKLVLYLTFSQFGESGVPQSLLELADSNSIFEIRNYDWDIRSYRKLIPALKDFPELYPTCVNGLNPKSVRDLKNWAKKGVCPEGNLIEIMACEGGCVAGSACLNNKRITTKKVNEYANSSKCINDLEEN